MTRVTEDRIRQSKGEARRKVAQAARESVFAWGKGEDKDVILARLHGVIRDVDAAGNAKRKQA